MSQRAQSKRRLCELASGLGEQAEDSRRPRRRSRSDTVESHKASSSSSGRVTSTLGFGFVTGISTLLAQLVIGFGGLLTMTKDAIPVASWHQAISLGI